MSGLIYKKMSDVMKDVGAITKDQKNQAQGFKFRGIDQFVNALYPALTRHGVFMTPRATSFTQELKEVQRNNGKAGVDKHVAIQMEYDFYAEDGSKVTVGPVPAEGLDSGDKATNKALSAALKYALIQTFSIPTEDMAEADLETPVIGSVVNASRSPEDSYHPIINSPQVVKLEDALKVPSPFDPKVVAQVKVETKEAAKPSGFRRPVKTEPKVESKPENKGDEW